MMACHYIIRSRLTNQVLDVEGGSMRPGARVVAWLTKNWSNQLWYDDPETRTIRVKATGFFLDLEDDTVVVTPFEQGRPIQRWKRCGALICNEQDPDQIIHISTEAKQSGSVVTVISQNKKKKKKKSQEFDFLKVPGLDRPYERRHFFIVSKFNSKVLDIRGENSKAGTAVIAWPKKKPAHKNQLWYFDAEGVIHSVLNDFVLETQQGSQAKVVPFLRIPVQEWTLVDSAILSKTGECLEIKEDQQKGAVGPVVSSKFYAAINQEWLLEFV